MEFLYWYFVIGIFILEFLYWNLYAGVIILGLLILAIVILHFLKLKDDGVLSHDAAEGAIQSPTSSDVNKGKAIILLEKTKPARRPFF